MPIRAHFLHCAGSSKLSNGVDLIPSRAYSQPVHHHAYKRLLRISGEDFEQFTDTPGIDNFSSTCLNRSRCPFTCLV